MWLVLLSACLVNHDLYEERKALLSDADGDGVTPLDGDCDDGDRTVSPGAVETCNEVDDDCDGVVDEDASDGFVVYEDVDGDGWGDPETGATACVLGAGQTTRVGDCDDGSGAVHPDAGEICDNGVDDDCDGAATGCGLSGERLVSDAEVELTLPIDTPLDSGAGLRGAALVNAPAHGWSVLGVMDGEAPATMVSLGHGGGEVAETGLRAAPLPDELAAEVSDVVVPLQGVGGSAFVGFASSSRDALGNAWVHIHRELPGGSDRAELSFEAGMEAVLVGASDLDGDSAAELFVWREDVEGWAVHVGASLLDEPEVLARVTAEGWSTQSDGISSAVGLPAADGTHGFVAIAHDGAPARGDQRSVLFVLESLAAEQDLVDADVTIRSGEAAHALGFALSTPAAADIDGDGHHDLVIASYSDSRLASFAGSVAVLRGPLEDADAWDPTWELRGETSYGAVGMGAAPGDFDRDGVPAIAVGWLDDTLAASAGAVGLWRPLDGGDSVDEMEDVVLGDTALQVAAVPRAADVDGDGADDLIVIAGGDGDTVPGAIYLHMGGGF